MSVRRRLRRWRRSFRRLAGETTAAALQVADAMLRPTPQNDLGPGTSWHELPPDAAATAERVRRDHVSRRNPGMY